jgi:hypothetical protein
MNTHDICRRWCTARARLLVSTALLFTSWASTANASLTYPVYLQKQFMTASPPGCTTCHATLAGGSGTTVGIPYAETLKAAGVVPLMPEAQFLALVSSVSAEDSDGDGASDGEELALEGNPNDPSVGPGGAAVEPIEYGCIGSKKKPPTAAAAASSSVAGAVVPSPALWLMLSAAGIIALRRRATR